MTAIALLCEIIAQGGKVPASFYRNAPAFTALLRHGYLREAGVVMSLVCNECEAPHAAPVVFEDGRYGYYCPDLGYSPLERTDLQAVQPDLPRLVERLAQTLECKRRKASALHAQTWRIGAVETDAGEITLYFHPFLQGEEDVTNLMGALAREVRSPYRLILTAAGTLPIPDAKSALLADVVEIVTNPAGIAVLADPRDIVEAPRKNLGGAPSRYQDILAPLIQSRIVDGTALDGRNKEAKAIQAILMARKSVAKLPSMSSIKYYVTKLRAGQ